MSSPSDLLRDAEVLRKLLTECLRRVDRLERRLSVEALDHEEATAASAATDPFEQALPNVVQSTPSRNASSDETRPHPAGEPTIRTLHVAPGNRLAPETLIGPHADPTPPQRPRPQPVHGTRVEKLPPSGDGTLDPFALLNVSVPSPEPLDAELRRGMNALLGGLDVSTPNGE